MGFYYDFDPALHIISDDCAPLLVKSYRSIDIGILKPFACLFYMRDKAGVFIYDEYFKRAEHLGKHAEWLNMRSRKEGSYEYTLCEPSSPHLQADLLEWGIPTVSVRHNIFRTIEETKRMLTTKKDAIFPLLTIHERCRNLIEQIRAYSYDSTGMPSRLQEMGCLDALHLIIAHEAWMSSLRDSEPFRAQYRARSGKREEKKQRRSRTYTEKVRRDKMLGLGIYE